MKEPEEIKIDMDHVINFDGVPAVVVCSLCGESLECTDKDTGGPDPVILFIAHICGTATSASEIQL